MLLTHYVEIDCGTRTRGNAAQQHADAVHVEHWDLIAAQLQGCHQVIRRLHVRCIRFRQVGARLGRWRASGCANAVLIQIAS